MLIPILISLLVAASLIIIIMVIVGAKKNGDSRKTGKVSSSVQKKGKGPVIKECEKKLAHDPHNVEALNTIGEIYYSDANWEKVWNVYKTLYDCSSFRTDIDTTEVTRRLGISAFFLKKFDEAVTYLLFSGKISSRISQKLIFIL